eukprot:CAMPEP_0119059370 /NCGR_PEP_ID=MMETSP1178-20130426/3540_1 /TAXON_ID=33656 /ORGANISM="unid sp, Strain CCMP2000" /LENGTH=30 /DNA_ID= /DNA_START= /DNA_END= /DNA_ORIENTATION=
MSLAGRMSARRAAVASGDAATSTGATVVLA